MAITLDKRTSDSTFDTAAAAVPTPGTIHVVTARFGTLEAEEDLIITLPEGMIGFDHCKRYIVLRNDDYSAFRWLQSLEEPTVAFPILEPREFCTDYAPTIADADARFLQLTPTTPILLFAIVTVPAHNPRELTANLLGPIVINPITRHGKQVIIQDQGYSTRHEIMEDMNRISAAKAA